MLCECINESCIVHGGVACENQASVHTAHYDLAVCDDCAEVINLWHEFSEE